MIGLLGVAGMLDMSGMLIGVSAACSDRAPEHLAPAAPLRSRPTRVRGQRVGEQDAADIEQRLKAGEEVKIGDLMILFGRPDKPVPRSNVDRWLSKGVRFGSKRMRIRYQIDPSGDRLCHPGDVLAVLAETRKWRDFEHPDGIPDQTAD